MKFHLCRVTEEEEEKKKQCGVNEYEVRCSRGRKQIGVIWTDE
jgi:hypothetical protein